MDKPKTSKEDLTLKIEELVQKRKTTLAKASIKKWLKSSPALESKLIASDWFRRLGDFKLAYRTIAPDHYHFSRVNQSILEAKRYLYCARMLNLMGASIHATS